MNNLSEIDSTVKHRLATNWPDAVDRSATSRMEFNRSLDEQLELQDWIGRRSLEENRFVTDFRIPLTASSSIAFERNTFLCGRFGYFRASLRIGADVVEATPVVDRAIAESWRWIRGWGALCEYRVETQRLSSGDLWMGIVCLIDPEPLGLISRDGAQRAVVAGTRFRVADLVAESRSFHWVPEELFSQHRPALTLPQIHAAFAHYHLHRNEIDLEIRQNDEAIEAAREAALSQRVT